MTQPSLPAELMVAIVDALIPEHTPIAYSASHIITKTLHSLSLTAKVTSPAAIRNLYTHCLHIKSELSLEKLVYTLKPWWRADPDGRESRSPDENSTPLAIRSPLLYNTPLELKSLYLAPFTQGNIQDLHIALLIHELFSILAPSLSRLVIDMPLRSVYPEDDMQGVRPWLRAAFSRLKYIEEFTSCQDELYLDVNTEEAERGTEPCVWGSWPDLKRLALYNADLSHGPIIDAFKQVKLTTFCLGRLDGSGEDLRRLSEWSQGSCKFLLVDSARGHLFRKAFFWEENCELSIEEWNSEYCVVDVEVPIPTDHGDAEEWQATSWDTSATQVWLEDRAVRRSLWDLPAATRSQM